MSNRTLRHSPCNGQKWIVAAIAFLLITSVGRYSLAQSEVVPTNKLLGKVADATLKSKRPSNGVVTDSATWQSLWTAWRPNITVAPVDFEKQIVLVETVDGPNHLVTTKLTLTSQGDLRYQAISPNQKDGPGFGYVLLVVPNDRVLWVNGKRVNVPISASPAVAMEPAMKPGATIPPVPAPTETKPPQTQPLTQPFLAVNPNAQSIKVEINGLIRTGTIGYGGLSTGAMVVANGIVWELDLRNDPELVHAARQLGANLGTIKGTLTKFDGPDRKERWIVTVDSINDVRSREAGPEPFNPRSAPGQMAGNNANEPNPLATPTVTPPRRNLPTPPMPNQPSTQPANDLALQNPMRQNPDQLDPSLPNLTPNNSAIPTRQLANSAQNTFRSIEIVARQGMRGGKQMQMIDANGTVKVEVPASNYFDSFNLSPDGLAKLHQYVGQTNWGNVPATTRSSADTNQVMNFEIRIETREGTKRIFIDGPSVGSMPAIRDLFLLLRRPKSS